MSKKKILIIVSVIFSALNIVSLPRGPHLQCNQGNGGKFAYQYGFPFIFLQRSVSISSCIITGDSTGDRLIFYGTAHVYFGNLIADVAIGTLALLGVYRYAPQKQSRKAKVRA
jgi:hypothetical protein